jgi:hypothetical protein
VRCRPPPDKTKDKEGVSLNRTPLNQRSRGQAPPPPPPPEHSDEEGEEEGEEVTLLTDKHVCDMVPVITQIIIQHLRTCRLARCPTC